LKRTLTAICLLAATSACLAACSSAPPTTAAVVAATTAAVGNAGSVSFVDVSRSGSGAITLSGSLSATAAQEVSTTSAGILLEVRLVATTLYVRSGTASWLESILGVPATRSSGLVGQWVSIPSSDSHYAGIAAALSIPALMGVYLPSVAKATVGTERRIAGREVLPLASRILGPSGAHQDTVLFVSTTDHLPAAGTVSVVANGATTTKQAVFRGWNRPVSVAAPDRSVTISSISP
jgi:hypothetical protein